MQAVILAAGRGLRMNDLTRDTPKPLLRFSGKNLIEHKIDILPDEIAEVVIVVGYLGHKIKEYFGNFYSGKTIRYIEQTDLRGTGAALLEAKDILQDRFIVMMGDDIYSASDIRRVMTNQWAILVYKAKFRESGAKVFLDKDSNSISKIVENSDIEIGDFINTGLYLLGKEIFNYGLVSIGKGEFGLPQMISLASKDVDIKIEEAEDWIRITTPEDLLI